MSKWKCEICGLEFENFHAQGFNHKIYCPLCYYKELYKINTKEIDRLNNILNELTDLILLKKVRAENEKDYSKYYIEGFTDALKTTHSTPDGIMLETVKSTTIAICKEILDKLKELKEDKDETKKEC